MATKKRTKRHTHRRAYGDESATRILQLLNLAKTQQTIDPLRMTDLGIAYWASFHKQLHGDATAHDWAVISTSLNAALILAEKVFANAHAPYIVDALNAAWRMKKRGDDLGAWRFDGPGINAVREALEIHDEQLQQATQAEINASFAEVRRRGAAGYAYT